MLRLFYSSLLLCIFSISLFAQQIDKSLEVIEITNSKLKAFQKQIDKTEDKRQTLLSKYKYKSSELKNTMVYNNQLQKILASQEKELENINKQIVDIENTQKNIFPLMLDMIKSLEKLVQMDAPFLLHERKSRVKNIKNALDKSDINTAEKYRIILEAFKIEYDYANTIETYQDKINHTTYDFLRLGRTALYCQSLDLKSYGYWNKKTNTWVQITNLNEKSNIKKAIKIAKKHQNVDLLTLPFLSFKDN